VRQFLAAVYLVVMTITTVGYGEAGVWEHVHVRGGVTLHWF
jgi:hypothetical protein